MELIPLGYFSISQLKGSSLIKRLIVTKSVFCTRIVRGQREGHDEWTAWRTTGGADSCKIVKLVGTIIWVHVLNKSRGFEMHWAGGGVKVHRGQYPQFNG